MGSGLQTREGRGRAVVVNALTKPTNILVPAGIVVAVFLLGWPLFAPLALVVYGLLVWFTLFDEREARQVLEHARASALPPPREISTAGLPPEIAEPLATAIAEEGKIAQAIAQAKLPYSEVSTEVGVLMSEMQKVAEKGGVIHAYLTDAEVESAAARLERVRHADRADGPAAEAQRMAIEALQSQVAIQAELADQFERCCAELEHLAASLGVIRGQIVRMSVAEDAAVQDDVAGQVRNLRERVNTLAEGLTEATAQLNGPAAA